MSTDLKRKILDFDSARERNFFSVTQLFPEGNSDKRKTGKKGVTTVLEGP